MGLAACLLALPAAALAQPSPASITQPDPIPRGRLGDAVQPRAYRLDLTVDPAQERFSGQVEIDVTVKAAGASHIYLHGRDLAMHQAAATIAGRRFPGHWTQVDDTGVVRLDFNHPLPAGPATLTFDYDAAFGDSPSGMFRVKVDGAWYSWSQFESIDARAAFPSFDQLSFKTPFTVTLRTPPGLVAVSNAPEQSHKREGGSEVHRFAPTLPLPTYLVAMMVGPFATADGAAPPTPQRVQPLPLRIVSTRPNAGRLTFALENSKPILALLEAYFGDSFPYPKLDQITSVMGGAMENAGADLYADSIVALPPEASTARKRLFGMVVAHELSHQWFGDLVTPMWWDDIWLNESFANWMGYRIGEAWRPDLNIRAGALAEGFEAMTTDALLAGRPIRQKIETNSQIDAAFDSITYGKGGHVVAMIAGFMGEDRFRTGVRRYLAAHRYGNATSTDFFAALAEAAGDPRIVPAMRSFTDQQGVPLLSFSPAGSGWRVSQSRYVAFGEAAPAQHWGVPLCVRRDGAPSCRLLTEDSTDLAIGGSGPLIPNAHGTGYYRFELPRAGWDALVAAADTLDGGEAQAVADSLAASLRAGRSDVAQLGELARRLARHPDSYAADAATNDLADLVNDGLADAAGRAGWQRYLGKLYAPLLREYGFDPRAGAYAAEDAGKSQHRIQIVGWVRASNRASLVRGKLTRATADYLAGEVSALDPGFFRDGFAAYLADKRLRGAKLLLERALASEDPGFRPPALAALGQSGSAAIAAWLLALSDARLRQSEKRDLLRDIILASGSRDYGYAWLRQHLDALAAGSSGIFFARLPAMLRSFCSTEKADEFARDLSPRLNGSAGELALDRTIEQVRNCGRLRLAKGAELSTGLARLQ
ncbi:MAG: M1 family metallopeptidase [Novosphingobium sp.]